MRSVQPQPSQVAGLSISPHLRNQAASSDVECVDLTMIDDTSDGESPEMRDRSPEPSQSTSSAPGYAQVVMDAQGVPGRIRASVNPENPSNFMQENLPNRETITAAASASTDSVLDNTPLTDDHKIKFLLVARREFQSERPSFLRLNKKEAAKTVTLADEKGFPQNGASATLVTRQWDPQTSFYTLDHNGETLIVKPYGRKSIYGARGGTQYSTWSGRGNVYEILPVAYSLNEDNEDQHNIHRDVENDVGSSLDNKPHRKFDSLAGGTSRVLVDPPRNGLDSEAESSTAASQLSEVTRGKHPANDNIPEDCFRKNARPLDTNTFIDSPITARIPPNLTVYQQERTILHVLLPGSASDTVPIELRSAMTISTWFSSVSAAARVVESGDLAIAITPEGKDGGQDKTFILRRDMIDTFEFFLESVDEATCWNEEGGRIALQLQLMCYHTVDLGVRV